MYEFPNSFLFVGGLISAFAITSLVLSWLTLHIRLKNRVMHRQKDIRAIQSLHEEQTPRIGGAALVIALLFTLVILPISLSDALLTILIMSLALYFATVREDLVGDVSAITRLTVTFIFSLLTTFVIWHTSVIGAANDTPMLFYFLVVLSTGASHACNLTDGANGVLGVFASMAFGGFATIAYITGDSDIFYLCLLCTSALSGFLCFNWPRASVFMGDAGAYAIGHMLVWIGVFLIARNPTLSPFAVCLIGLWPLKELALTVFRRVAGSKPLFQPDRAHFHHRVYDALCRSPRLQGLAHLHNAGCVLLIAPFMLLNMICGVMLLYQPTYAALALVFSVCLFLLAYTVLSYWKTLHYSEASQDPSFEPLLRRKRPSMTISPRARKTKPI